MKSLLIIILSILPSFTNITFTHIKDVKVEYDFSTTDQLENVYAVKGNRVIKFDNQGIKQSEYSNSYLGRITSIDASDPFRILLFYKDFNQILFLDKTMTALRSPIKLEELKIDFAELACSSNQGGFWIYSNYTNQILYYDKNLELKDQSIGLNSLVDPNYKPNFLIEKNEFLYLNIPDLGILVFDRFGSYYKTIHIENINSFQVIEDNIIYFKDNFLIKYNPQFLTSTKLALPDTSNITGSCIERKKLYIFKQNSFSIYQINN